LEVERGRGKKKCIDVIKGGCRRKKTMDQPNNNRIKKKRNTKRV